MELNIMSGNNMLINKVLKNQQGFSLMELLVVLVIVGLLASLVGPSLYKRIKPAKQSVARAQIENYSNALDQFFIDVGRYPTSKESLAVLRKKIGIIKKWNGPYLKKNLAGDPWGSKYYYRSPGKNGPFDIISYGADGKIGGQDENQDINSWEN